MDEDVVETGEVQRIEVKREDTEEEEEENENVGVEDEPEPPASDSESDSESDSGNLDHLYQKLTDLQKALQQVQQEVLIASTKKV